jgi:hypothetical protein
VRADLAHLFWVAAPCVVYEDSQKVEAVVALKLQLFSIVAIAWQLSSWAANLTTWVQSLGQSQQLLKKIIQYTTPKQLRQACRYRIQYGDH